MVAINADGRPLVELGPITDIWADGLDRIEIIGQNFRPIFFTWKIFDGIWQRVAVEYAIRRPLEDCPFDLRAHGFKIIELTKGQNSHALVH